MDIFTSKLDFEGCPECKYELKVYELEDNLIQSVEVGKSQSLWVKKLLWPFRGFEYREIWPI
jgi:hypothetical protein